MNRNKWGILLMVLSATFLATSVIMMKQIPLLTNLTPKDVGIWRFTIAAPLLWLVRLFSQAQKPARITQHGKYLFLGLVFTLASFNAVIALEYIPSSLFAIIIFIYPSLVVLFSIFTGRSVPRLFWIGLPLTLVGLFLVSYDFDAKLSMGLFVFLITLLNAIWMAAYVILSEKAFRNTEDILTGTNWVMTGAMIAGLALIPFLGIRFPDSHLSWLLIVAFGIFGTLLPILTMNIGLQYLGAARGSVIITLQPVMTVLFSTLFLHETLSPQQWVGGLLVIAAVIMLQLSKDRAGRKEPKQPHASDGTI